MNGMKTRFAVALAAAVFLFGGSLAANNVFAQEHFAQEHKVKYGHDFLFSVIHKLNLTNTQKQQVAAILTGQEPQAKTIATGLAQAKLQLYQTILSGQDVTGAWTQVATLSLQSAMLRSAIIAQIIPILTADQQGALQNIQAKIGNSQSMIGSDQWLTGSFARWDKFIAKYSGQ